MTNRSFYRAEPEDILPRFTDSALRTVAEKVFSGSRLDLTDGLTCLQTSDLLGLGATAHWAKRRRYGDNVFFVVNHHLNYTNICGNKCRFCAFHRAKEAEDAYLLSPQEAADQIRSTNLAGLREVHLVGGINPDPDFSYYIDLLRALRGAAPNLELKAFTAVEIDHIAKKGHLSWSECLSKLKEAGLSALPGGGAEVFSERIRQKLFPNKIPADEWLGVHGTAHSLGIGTNATLLFGHMETLEERVAHFIRLREQQDSSKGFRAFIPLVFHPRNTAMAKLTGPDGVDILKTIATSRLMLDNFPHIKSYWIMLGRKMAQTALHFGADDLEGTVVHEKITHQAGAETAVGLSRKELEGMIVDAGFDPVERDTFHQAVNQ